MSESSTVTPRERIALDAAAAYRVFGPHGANPHAVGTEEHKAWAAAVAYAVQAEHLEGSAL